MKRRIPKDADHYLRSEDAAQALREVASRLIKNHVEGELVKWELKLSYWRPEAPRV